MLRVTQVLPGARGSTGRPECRRCRFPIDVPAERAARRRRGLAVLRAYVALTKPRIVELLLVTTLPAMILAAGGLPPLSTVLATMVGGSLAAGSANALNCYLDRDIDAVMRRTIARPLARHAVSPRSALVFGIVLGAVSIAIMLSTGWLPAALTAVAILFYVLVYTLVLKRRTAQNIVWGGAAGCMPVLIGWAAVTGSLAWAPVVLFGIVFFWTPPHFWALAMRFKDDYARAGVPMLPVVATPLQVARRIVGYTWLTVGTSLLLWPLATSWVYGVVALAAGGWFLAAAHGLLARVKRGAAGQDAAAVPPLQLLPGDPVRRGGRRRAGALSVRGLGRNAGPARRVPRIALATCRQLPVGDEDAVPLLAACSAAGLDAEWRIWDDPAVDWGSYDLVVIRATWDYAPRRDDFAAWAASVPRLANPADVVAWNTDKTYLRELAEAGVPVVPTAWLAPGAPADWPDWPDVVVKPTVSSGAQDTARYGPGERDKAGAHADRLLAAGRPVMVQPYLAGVDTAGESMLVHVGGGYSHGFRKEAILQAGEAAETDALFRPEEVTVAGADRGGAGGGRAGAGRRAGRGRPAALRPGRPAAGRGR